MISPTSRMIPVETELTEEQFNGLAEVIEIRTEELKELGRKRYRMVSMALGTTQPY